jgi:hypothetical protein
MIIEFDKSFEKSIVKLKDKELKDRLIQIIYSFDEAKSIHDIKNVKKIVVLNRIIGFGLVITA